jgi:hypothetical protein
MQPCSCVTPAASGGGVVLVEGVAGAGPDAGPVVVVVVDGGTVVVVVVVGGTVVVVDVGSGKRLAGSVVVVVVVGGTVVVVVVGATVVVVVAFGGAVVVVVVVVLVDPEDADGIDGGGVMVTVAQAPACSRVATSLISWVRSRVSATSSEVSFNAACAKALAASPRWCWVPLSAPAAALLSVMRLSAATPRYCCATTPSESCGLAVNGCVLASLTSGAPE